MFGVELSNLYKDAEMKTSETMTWEEQRAIEYVRDVKGFYSHALTYVLVMSGLFLLNYLMSPGYIWAWYSFSGWGAGLLAHGLSVLEVFAFFGTDWEKNK